MSNGINSSQGWGLLKNLVANMGGNQNVSNADVQEILKSADTNNDNIVTEDEFISCFQNSELYQSTEDQYLQAFKVISMVDGDVSSMSFEDITSAIEAYEKMNKPAAANKTPDTNAPAGGKEPTGKQPTTQPTAPAAPEGNNTPVADAPQEGTPLPELQSKRADAIGTLTALQTDRNTAMAQASAAVEANRNAYNTATTNFTEAVLANEEGNEQLSEAGQLVVDLQGQKDAINKELGIQENAVTSANTAVSTIQSSLDSLSAPAEKIRSYDETTGQTVEKDNPAYKEYLDKKAALEAELAAAQQDLQDNEEALKNIKTELSDIETQYNDAMNAYMESENVTAEQKQALIDAQTAVDTANSAYEGAKVSESRIEGKYAADIQAAQSTVDAYDREIAKAQLEEQGIEVPEGYEVDEKGNIVNNEDGSTLNLVPASEDGTLPEGWKETTDGKIVDEKGNEVKVNEDAEGNITYMVREEAQPEPLSFTERNEIANTLFDDPNANWKDTLEGLNDEDIAKIQSLYDERVQDYNAEAVAMGTTDYGSTRENFALSAEDKLAETDVLAEVEDALEKAEIEANDSFADFILEQGLQKPEDLDVQLGNAAGFHKLDDFKADLEEYNKNVDDLFSEYMSSEHNIADIHQQVEGSLTPEMQEVIGDPALLERQEGEEDWEYQARIQGIIEDIIYPQQDELGRAMTDENMVPIYQFTPEERMVMLNYLKDASSESFTALQETIGNSTMLSSDMVGAVLDSDNPAVNVTELLEFNAQLFGESERLSFSGNSAEMVTIFENATPDQMKVLMQYVDIADLANNIQTSYTNDVETEYMQRLMKCLTGGNNMSVSGSDYGVSDPAALTAELFNSDTVETLPNLSANQKETKMKVIMNAVINGTIQKNEAQYLLSVMYGGSSDAMVESFRGLAGLTEEAYIYDFFGIYKNGLAGKQA